jgi:hypothetical protein
MREEAHCSVALLKLSRMLRFGCECAIEKGQRRFRTACQGSRDAIVTLDVAENPRAAMQVQNDRKRPFEALRHYDANAHFSVVADGNGHVLQPGGQEAGEIGLERPQRLPPRVDRQQMRRGQATLLRSGQESLGFAGQLGRGVCRGR